ncbi:hypothetical protein RB195_014895 [Necator americanus]|uniref:SCP domain-containing protein n=1 Tax=Necator americanus TaxID=51031 RepID=A0ABR1E2I8_NECAM
MFSSSLILVAILTGGVAATEFQCWDLHSTDEIRAKYRNFINNHRSTIASGTATGKDSAKLPQGKNIYRLIRSK